MAKDRDTQRQTIRKKSEVLFIRVDVELADRLRELASQDDRKLSPYLYRVLKKYVESLDRGKQ